MLALAVFPSSTASLVKGPCNPERSDPFYRNYNTSPLTGCLLVVFVVPNSILPLVETVVLHLPCTLEGRQ
jgi:hypothetical protein